MYEIRKLGIVSTAWVTSVLAVIVYFGLTILSLVNNGLDVSTSEFLLSVLLGAIIVLLASVIFGCVAAGIYNFTAQRWGGLTVDLRHIGDGRN